MCDRCVQAQCLHFRAASGQATCSVSSWIVITTFLPCPCFTGYKLLLKVSQYDCDVQITYLTRMNDHINVEIIKWSASLILWPLLWQCVYITTIIKLGKASPMTWFCSDFIFVGIFASMQAIRKGWVHPNINLDNPEKSVVWSRCPWFSSLHSIFFGSCVELVGKPSI